VLENAPAKATAVIFAERTQDQSDSMTDYFGSITAERIAIGYRTGSREDFRQLRRAAANYPPTADLGPGKDAWSVRVSLADGESIYCPAQSETFPTEDEARAAAVAWAEGVGYDAGWSGDVIISARMESIEHRDNHAGGRGNWLGRGYQHNTGWKVCSYTLPREPKAYRPELHGTHTPAPPATPAAPSVESPNASGEGWTLETHFHTKKETDIFIIVLSNRVDADRFRELTASAKRAGGWYSRAWHGSPGGFAFNTPEDATAWATATL
jgi:hypothetical protein